MNEHFKTVEEVEYHIHDWELETGEWDRMVSPDYNDARIAYANGSTVFEYRTIRYAMEWSKVEHTVEYEWHKD
jgi:hypothetical protein